MFIQFASWSRCCHMDFLGFCTFLFLFSLLFPLRFFIFLFVFLFFVLLFFFFFLFLFFILFFRQFFEYMKHSASGAAVIGNVVTFDICTITALGSPLESV